MLLERTISQLDTGPMPPDEAWQLGQLGYMQWLAGLPGGVDYRHAALEAYARALPFSGHSLAVEAFCSLLQASADNPLTLLPLALPPNRRRGGAAARRARRLPL
ncbi:hypothetical protein [Vannielia litorea]|uniref:hypothetical protein n=1 Tax=Vannielia litorea TaxID=1217970 RepID=UPI001BCAE644|nr:hypothetical protein [Vannielia litorea]MBS8227831.1 hypothetical protein [Vannielia litorea]